MRIGFIVEGVMDKEKIERLDTRFIAVQCRGTVLNNSIRGKIEELLHSCNAVYILTDPDHQGDLFASQLQYYYPLQRILLDPNNCWVQRAKGKRYGVEYASDYYLRGVIRQYTGI